MMILKTSTSPKLYSGFLDELHKLAAGKSDPEEEKAPHKLVRGLALAVVAPTVGSMIATPIAGSLASAIQGGSKAKIDSRDVAALVKDLSPDTLTHSIRNPLGSKFVPREAASFLPKNLRKQIYREGLGVPEHMIDEAMAKGIAMAPLDRSPEFLAHELGHASLRDPKKTGVLLRTLIKARGLGPLAGLVGGTAMAVQDPESTTAQLAPVAVLGGYVPMLTDEALASKRGLDSIRRLGKFTGTSVKDMRGSLLKAFGTYGALAAASTLPYLAYTQRHRLLGRE